VRGGRGDFFAGAQGHEAGEGDVAEAGEGAGAEAFDFALGLAGVEEEFFDDLAVVEGGVFGVVVGELFLDPGGEVVAVGGAEGAELGEPVVADEFGGGGDAGGDGAAGAEEEGVAVVGLFGELAEAAGEFDGGDGAQGDVVGRGRGGVWRGRGHGAKIEGGRWALEDGSRKLEDGRGECAACTFSVLLTSDFCLLTSRQW
jgi:hypothetical protein